MLACNEINTEVDKQNISFADNLKEVLSTYIQTVFDPKVVKLHRSRTPLGLIKARSLGVRMATGDIIVCMDSHVEVQDHW